ncbi:MAG: extracellular solute-binding protein [Anaerolineae bacterium]|nr:extracellular solute-binding protein [Anaerolineae bacterium]
MSLKKGLSRRDFLKIAGFSVVPLAVQHLPLFQRRALAQAVELSMWTWYIEQEDEFPRLDEEFNATHDDIKIQNRIYGLTEYLPVLESAIAGGVGPDILGPHVHAIEYGLAGQTVDLNAAMGEAFMSQFFPPTRRQFAAGDAQYALGWMAQTFGFFSNPALFDQAGVAAPPETWDELIEISDIFKGKGILPWVFNESDKWLGADFFLPLITQATDDPNLVYALDEHTDPAVSWNSEPVIAALGLIDRLVKAGVFQEGVVGTNWDQATALFYSGGSAMFFAGSWVPQGIVQNAPPEFASSYRVFKTPAWAPGKTHWTGNQAGAALAVNAKGQVDAAVEYLKWLYEPDRYATAMNNSLSMPSTEAAAELVNDPIMKEMTSWLPEGAPHILFGAGSWDAVSNAVQGVFAQTLTPEQAAEQMENDVVAVRSR